MEQGSADDAIADLDCKRVPDRRDRPALGSARATRARSVCSTCAGVTSVRPRGRRARVRRSTSAAPSSCWRSACAPAWSGWCYTSSAAAVGPAEPGKTADETQLFTAGRLGIPYVNSVHEAEVEAMRLAARGLPLVCVNPTIAFGAGDVHLTSTRLVRSFLLGRVPIYTDGAAERRRRARRGRGPPARRPARRGGRALHPRRPQLHVRPALRRPRPPLGRGPTGEAPSAPGRGGGAGARAPPAEAVRCAANEVRAAEPLVDLPLDQGQARAGLEARARTRRRSRRRWPGTSSASTTGSRAAGAPSSSSTERPARRPARWRRRWAAASGGWDSP